MFPWGAQPSCSVVQGGYPPVVWFQNDFNRSLLSLTPPQAKDFRAAAMIMVFGAWKGYVRQLHETVRKMQRRRQRIWFDAWRRRTGESARETLVHEIEELEARVEEFMRNKSTSKGSGVDLDALLKPHSYLTRLLNAQAGQLGGGKNSDGIQNDGGGGSGAQPPPMQSRRRLTRRGSSMRLAVVNGRKTVVVRFVAHYLEALSPL